MIEFPPYSGIRCLMMPFVQGDMNTLPDELDGYRDIVWGLALQTGEIGYLTIDESPVRAGEPQRGARAKHGRALHTEAGIRPGSFGWGGHGWGSGTNVYLDRDTEVIIANSLDNSCAVWETEHEATTFDGDIGHLAHLYPYRDARIMRAGEVVQMGILTPHESLPVVKDCERQFLRIVGHGVIGREPYFTINPKGIK